MCFHSCIYFPVLYRTFGDVWISMLKVHENIGNQRIKFAASISDSAEDLLSLGRNIEKDRKKIKDAGMHYEKLVSDSDFLLEKVSHNIQLDNLLYSSFQNRVNKSLKIQTKNGEELCHKEIRNQHNQLKRIYFDLVEHQLK